METYNCNYPCTQQIAELKAQKEELLEALNKSYKTILEMKLMLAGEHNSTDVRQYFQDVRDLQKQNKELIQKYKSNE